MNILYPEIYQDDIFFKYGSQASFTVFPFIHALVVQQIGVDNGACLLTVIGLSLFFVTTLSMTRIFLTPAQTALFLIFFTTLPVFFNPVLYVFEVFLTSRTISLGLSILFLSLVLKRRIVSASIFLIIALMLHPLVPLGAIAIALFLQRPSIIITVTSLGILLLIIGLVFSIPPISLLTQTIDQSWFELIKQRSPFLFIYNWQDHDLNLLLLEICIILSAKSYCTDKLKRVFNAVLIATALCLLISLVASWLLNTLLIQLQPWRILVFTHIFAVIAFTWIISAAWIKDSGKVVILLYFSLFLSLDSIGSLPALAIHFFWRYSLKHHYAPPPILIKGAYAILLQCAFWYILNTDLVDPSITTDNFIFRFASNLKYWLNGSPFYITAFLMVLLFYSTILQKKITIFLSIAILLLSPLVLFYFDQRYRSTTWNSGNSEPYISLRKEIPINATVYCEIGVEACWFLLRRKQYMSPKQSAGIVFSRETAFESKRRADLLLRAGFEDGVFPRHWHKNLKQTSPTPTFKAFNELCQDPILDYIITTSPFMQKIPDKIVNAGETKMNIYYCSPMAIKHVNKNKY
ncbi:MAG: hypothetical protein AB2535_15555 [Candidatus Thiodiazotropha endolucinida]